MNINKIIKSVNRRISFHGMSIQHRLPFFICILLSTVIIIFGLVSYYTVKNVNLELGKKRLRTLTEQLGTMFSQSAKTLNTVTLAVAAKDSIKKYVQSGGKELKEESLDILTKLRRDSTWLLAEILDSDKKPMLWSGNKSVESKLPLDSIFSTLFVNADSSKIGKMYVAGDSIYYPVVATITEKKLVQGYLVIWRKLSSNPKGLEQLSQLMGTGATLYVGNTDRNLWTNLIKPIPNPLLKATYIQNFHEYFNDDGKKIIAGVQQITNTPWLVLVEFSEQNILETASRFLYKIIIIGSMLIILGFIVTWFMSRNIIMPLTKLTSAASTIAAGDYSSHVNVNRRDELGKLANAFNIMVEQIHITQSDLENKVKERTLQLEIANKEMESFTYSVSHDLRAPLRIINGYAQIVKEDCADNLPDESNRMLQNIIHNAKRMGNLIDDLLNFSRLGRRELNTNNTDMNEIVNPILQEQLNGKINYKIKVQHLHQCNCDSSLIKQVWENLISNAVKYSSNTSDPIIEIGSVKENNKTVYSVKDNGAGFDMKYYDKLFGVFQRLHKNTEFEGTGVGLALAQRIISKHGGKIWAESTINEGSTFYFTVCRS